MRRKESAEKQRAICFCNSTAPTIHGPALRTLTIGRGQHPANTTLDRYRKLRQTLNAHHSLRDRAYGTTHVDAQFGLKKTATHPHRRL